MFSNLVVHCGKTQHGSLRRPPGAKLGWLAQDTPTCMPLYTTMEPTQLSWAGLGWPGLAWAGLGLGLGLGWPGLA